MMLGVPLVPAQFALSASPLNAGISQPQPLHQLTQLSPGLCGQQLPGCPQQTMPGTHQVPPGQPFFQGLPLVAGATPCHPPLAQDSQDGGPQQLCGLPQQLPEQNQAQIHLQQMQLQQLQRQQQMLLQQQQQQQQVMPVHPRPPSQSEQQLDEGKPGTSGTTQQTQLPLTAEPLPSGERPTQGHQMAGQWSIAGTVPEAAASTSMLLGEHWQGRPLGTTSEGFIPAGGTSQPAQEQPSSSLPMFGCPLTSSMPFSTTVGSAASVMGSQGQILTGPKGNQASNLQSTLPPNPTASNEVIPPSMNMLASIAATQMAADGGARTDAGMTDYVGGEHAGTTSNPKVPNSESQHPHEAKRGLQGLGEPSTMMQTGTPANGMSTLQLPTAGVPEKMASALPGVGRMQSTETPQVAQLAAGPAAAVLALRAGDAVEAQCAGWGSQWFPGVVRELLPGGEVQVLWDGDEPSISNLPPSSVRPRQQQQQQQGDKAGETVACSASAPAPQSTPTTLPSHQQQGDSPAQVFASGGAQAVQPACEDTSGGQTQKRSLTDTVQPGVQTSPTLRDAVAASPRSYRYELGPGDDVAAPMANLRRRVSAELRDGCSVTVQIRIVRPGGRPEADKEQCVPAGVIANASETPPPQSAPPTPGTTSVAVAGQGRPSGDAGTTDGASTSNLGPCPGNALPPPWRRSVVPVGPAAGISTT